MADQQSVDLSTPEAQAEALALADKAIAEADGTAEETTEEVAAEEAAKPAEETPEEKPAAAVVEQIEGQLDMAGLAQEYADNGELSPASRETVLSTMRGIFGDASESVLDNYLAGTDAQSAALETQVFTAAGGEENFNSMIEWANENLPLDERQSYHAAINDPAYSQMAIRDLRSKFEGASGTSPAAPDTSRVAAPAVVSAGATPINSQQSLAKAVSDPKYLSDPGHRAAVDQQIAAAARAGKI